MSLAKRKVAVVVLAALLAGAAVFAGSSAPGFVDDANATAGGAKAEEVKKGGGKVRE